MAQSGIYAIEHAATGRNYIGSAADFERRWDVHRCLLRKGKHHSPFLQNAWNKYGEAAFVFKRLLICAKDNLLFYEQRAIDAYKAFDRTHGFNARPLANSQIGLRHSEEARAKIRAARAKQIFSPETRALWSKNRTGRKMPEWFSKFTSDRCRGVKPSAETRAKMSAAKKGKPLTLAQIEIRNKLTQATADEIRRLYSAGDVRQTDLARRFNVRPATISNVISGKRWSKFTTVDGGGAC